MAKPFHVMKLVDANQWASHLENIAGRSRVNLDHLCGMARRIREEGSTETPVSHWATRGEADADAADRNAANTDSWVTFVAEYLDVDEDWWTS